MKSQVYRPDEFTYEVLGEFDSRDIAQEYEIFLHMFYDVSANSSFYNRARSTSSRFNTTGLRFKHKDNSNYFGPKSEEHKSNLSNACKGIIKAEEHRRNISIHHADMSGTNNPMYGKYGIDSVKVLVVNIIQKNTKNI